MGYMRILLLLGLGEYGVYGDLLIMYPVGFRALGVE